MSENNLEKKPHAGWFVVSIFFLLNLAIFLFVVLLAIFEVLSFDFNIPAALMSGIVLSVLYALIIFIIPYFRRSGTLKTWAWWALGDAAWWGYLLFSAQ